MIDMTKKYRTRDGREAVVLAILKNDRTEYPVVGFISNGDQQQLATWTNGGINCASLPINDLDLIEVKPRIKVWVNLYSNNGSALHPDRASADKHTHTNRIACVEIDVEHGHGLDK